MKWGLGVFVTTTKQPPSPQHFRYFSIKKPISTMKKNIFFLTTLLLTFLTITKTIAQSSAK
jgi:hypothetical protein